MCKIAPVGSLNPQVILIRVKRRLPNPSQSTVDIYINHCEGLSMNYKGLFILMLCICLVATTGCMSLGTAGSSASSPQVNTVYDSGVRLESAKESSYGGAVPAPAAAIPSPRDDGSGAIETKVIKTAYVTIEVKDVTGSVESLKAMAADNGGYLSSTNVQKNYNDRLTGTVVMRIPQAQFESTLAGVKAIGTVKSASTQGEDVTEEYVDLQAQKTSYQNQLAQYNEIMKKAVKVSDVIEIQAQIDRVQTELNRLDGKLKYLNSRVDLSTITVTLQEPEPVGGETGHNFVSTINEGIAGFLGMIDAIIILFFTFLPLLILGGIGYYTYRWNKNRKGPVVTEENKDKK